MDFLYILQKIRSVCFHILKYALYSFLLLWFSHFSPAEDRKLQAHFLPLEKCWSTSMSKELRLPMSVLNRTESIWRKVQKWSLPWTTRLKRMECIKTGFSLIWDLVRKSWMTRWLRVQITITSPMGEMFWYLRNWLHQELLLLLNLLHLMQGHTITSVHFQGISQKWLEN